MGLPIAIGTKNVSFYSLPSAKPVEEFSDDGRVLHPSEDRSSRLFAVTTSKDQQLQAIVTVSYYDMLHENGEKDHTLAEICVQVSPLTEAFSTNVRESVFRLPLPGGMEPADNLRPQVLFSSDRRFLSCLVPYSQASNVVIFQLRKPREALSSRTANLPPLPSYIQPSSAVDLVPVATNPRVLKSSESLPLLKATCLCDMPMSNTPGPSLLLVGCSDGYILAASYRSVAVAGVLFENKEKPVHLPEQMDHSIESYNQEDGMLGRLVVVDSSGDLRIFRSRARESTVENQCVSVTKYAVLGRSSSSFNDDIEVEDVVGVSLVETAHSIQGPFLCAKWAGFYLALMAKPTKDACTVLVFGTAEDASWPAHPISSTHFSHGKLEETATTTLRMDPSGSDEVPLIQASILSSLEYDPWSGCLAISSFLEGNGKHKDIFCSLWHWRTNTQGLTIAKKCALTSEDFRTSFIFSALSFARDGANSTRLLDMTVLAIAGPATIRKDMFDTGLLSPPSNKSLTMMKLDDLSAVILSAGSISCPRLSESSTRGDYEVEMVEAIIPSHYTSLFGSPTIASIGSRRGQSVSIAARNGVCTLDLSGTQRLVLQESAVENRAPLYRIGSRPKWYTFRSDTEARNFEIVGMGWWEGCEQESFPSGLFLDDVLIAVIRVETATENGYFLACWTKKMLDLGHQLLRSIAGDQNKSAWGVRLPPGFSPTKLSLLEQPECLTVSQGTRKVTVLVSGDKHTTDYAIYQLQALPLPGSSTGSYIERQPFEILARCATTGSIGDSADLILGSCSFSFDLKKNVVMEDLDEDEVGRFIATIGVNRHSGPGFDALAVSVKGVSHFGQVVPSILSDGETMPDSNRVCSLWISDILERKELSSIPACTFYIWTLHMTDGKFLTWAVPVVSSTDDLNIVTKTHLPSTEDEPDGFASVHPKSTILGLVCPGGNAERWMQLSASVSGTEYPSGPLRLDSFSCMVGLGQDCHKLHRSLGQQFESNIFRSDFLDHEFFCPGSSVLYPPAFLPTMYSLVLDSVASESYNKNTRSSALNSYLQRKLEGTSSGDSSMMALQLLILRIVEKATDLSKRAGPRSDLLMLQNMFRMIVDATRRRVSPLRFASLFLEVGRQIEPSCYGYLFPLPAPLERNGRGETLETLFNLTLKEGSIRMAAASLPLFTCYETSRSVCSAVFHKCLSRLVDAVSVNCGHVENQKEERAVVGDLFRYGIKLENEMSFESGSIQGGNISISDNDSEENDKNNVTIFCGISRFFTPKKSIVKKDEDEIIEAASSFIVNGFDREQGEESISSEASEASGSSAFSESIEGVASVAARYLISSLLSGERRIDVWNHASSIARVLLGDSVSGYRIASREVFRALIAETKVTAFQDAISTNGKGRTLFSHFFKEKLRECRSQIDTKRASRIVDLSLILLDTETDIDDLEPKSPAMILIALVAADASGRIADILPENFSSSLTSSYFEALFELSQEGKSPPQEGSIV